MPKISDTIAHQLVAGDGGAYGYGWAEYGWGGGIYGPGGPYGGG